MAKAKNLNAAKLLLGKLDDNNYNCFGTGILKEDFSQVNGFEYGMSTRETFDLVRTQLGKYNVREVESAYSKVDKDEWLVAMKVGTIPGKEDYHFIPKVAPNLWLNKSGNGAPVFIPTSKVTEDTWYAMIRKNEDTSSLISWVIPEILDNPNRNYPIYNDETIYFALKKDWYQ